MGKQPQHNKQALDRRAKFLAEKFNLSLQLTAIWIERNPEKARRPMLASSLRELKKWARV